MKSASPKGTAGRHLVADLDHERLAYHPASDPLFVAFNRLDYSGEKAIDSVSWLLRRRQGWGGNPDFPRSSHPGPRHYIVHQHSRGYPVAQLDDPIQLRVCMSVCRRRDQGEFNLFCPQVPVLSATSFSSISFLFQIGMSSCPTHRHRTF
jgi:hypothetical protein